MVLTVKSYLRDAEVSLKNWKERELNPKFDGSMPKECVIANTKHKVEVYTEVVAYLKSLNSECVLSTERGLTEEGAKYFEMVNK